MADANTGGADLALKGVTKSFGTFHAVDDLDLLVPEGSFFALLGPSGCGKTTTLRMVAGLEEPTAGTITLGGTDVTHAKAFKRPVNTVFQNYALFPHLDIYENVAFGLRRRKVGNVDAAVKEALELVELGHVAKRRPAQLSGGQQQRVALARAVVNRPKVLLLDEPLGALDLKLRRAMQLELKRIQTEVGITFVHVTHDQEEAMTMADTVAVMNAGRIEQLGSPRDLYEAPQTTFVANFLGQSNLVAGKRTSSDGDLVVVSSSGSDLRVPASRVAPSASSAAEVLVGVRPEKITMNREPAAPGLNSLGPVTVVDASFMGVSTQYVVRTGWDQTLTVFCQNLGPEDSRFVPGDGVYLSWAPEHTFVLAGDAAAGVDEDTLLAVGTV